MKKLAIIIMAVLCLQFGYSQSLKPKLLKSEITEAKVYPQGAQVIRQAQVRLSAGESRYLFTGLPSSLDANSIQVKGIGDFLLIGVNHSLNYLSKSERSEKIDSLQSLLNKNQSALNSSIALSEILAEELSLLNANKDLGGQNGTDINALKTAMVYYRSELTRIKNSQITEKEHQESLRLKINDIQRQLNVLNNQRDQPSSDVEIIVRASRITDVKLSLSYFTYNAGWTPSYDVRINSVAEPIALTYKASVYQNTGEDWNQVKLIFSSARPNQGGTAPTLQPWYLRPITPQPLTKMYSQSYDREAPAAARSMMAEPAMEEEVMQEMVMVSEVKENQTSVDFVIPMPYTVKSTGNRTSVDLNQYDIPAIYEYFAVPKLDKDAFLMARVFDWDQYSLLPGQMNLYFEDGYVGKSMLDPGSQDTLNLSLGRDKGIVIERKKVDEFSKKKTIGMNKVESRGYDIEVRNTKKQDIQITIFDQLPVSANSEIEVRTLKVGDADFSSQTGELKWKMKLSGQSSNKLSFQYEVRYPKKLRLTLD